MKRRPFSRHVLNCSFTFLCSLLLYRQYSSTVRQCVDHHWKKTQEQNLFPVTVVVVIVQTPVTAVPPMRAPPTVDGTQERQWCPVDGTFTTYKQPAAQGIIHDTVPLLLLYVQFSIEVIGY